MLAQLQEEATLTWSVELQLAAGSYLTEHKMRAQDLLPVDAVLMLLRIGTREALERVTELTGKPITRCPSAVPPWPPKPVARPPSAPVLCHVESPNPCLPSTEMHGRFDRIKQGMTRERMKARGVTDRDIRYWTKNGHIRFTP